MTAPPRVRFLAQLVPVLELPPHEHPAPTSWFITHPIGTPSGGTYTEVRFIDEALGELVHAMPAEVAMVVLEQITREVAVQLYGTAWAFVYAPDRRPAEPRRRELVVVTWFEVLS